MSANHTENLSAAEIAGAEDEEIDHAEHDFWREEMRREREEAYAEAEMARWDDDPSPYDGTYSEC